MAVTNTPSFPQLPKNGKAQIVNGNGVIAQNVYVGGVNGSKIVSCLCVNTDTSPHTVQLAITRSGVNYLLGTVNVGASAGNQANLAPVELLRSLPGDFPLDSDGNPYIFLNDNNEFLTVAVTSPMAVATSLFCVAIGADF